MCDNGSVVFPTHCISWAQAFTVHFVRRLQCNIKYTCRLKELKYNTGKNNIVMTIL